MIHLIIDITLCTVRVQSLLASLGFALVLPSSNDHCYLFYNLLYYVLINVMYDVCIHLTYILSRSFEEREPR